ncbi:hypothetical protein GLOIN_2v1474421 [Rhizophagus irregularis DAOM 181602=DAOM 197198]|nr:hypothetical protein GLOIN_2v1474421 [Rhizophagus irregularis DAOM 181602=DAOM 197198]CAG8534837.1 4412_t:CDS:2 [Rhizophagus irregularis]
MPSIFKETGEAYYLSIMDTIHHILNNLSLLVNIHEELELAYEDFRDSPVILNNTPSYFEYASFVFEKEQGSTILHHLHIGNVIFETLLISLMKFRSKSNISSIDPIDPIDPYWLIFFKLNQTECFGASSQAKI